MKTNLLKRDKISPRSESNKKGVNVLNLFIFLCVFFIVGYFSNAQTTYYTRGSGGNWSNPNTWSTAGCNGSASTSVPLTLPHLFK